MGILERFNDYERSAQYKKTISTFSEETILRAENFFTAHGKEEGNSPLIVLGYMRDISEMLGETELDGDKAPGATLRDKLSAMFLAHDNIDKPCEQGEECLLFHDIAGNFDNLVFYSEGFMSDSENAETRRESELFRTGLHRILEIMVEYPRRIYLMMESIIDLYDPFDDSDEKNAGNTGPHLNALCDLYATLSPEDKEETHPDILVSLTSPVGGNHHE